MASRTRSLRWLERALIAAGALLGLWTVLMVGEQWYYARMPIPQDRPTDAVRPRALPGEDPSQPVGTSGSRSRRVARGSWLARLEAPRIRMAATVLEGSDDRTLRRAAGHIEYTALPGEDGNIGIAGHRDTTFRALRHLKVGDPLTLTTAARVYEYQVSRIWIVEPEDVEVLDSGGRQAITLVTCYPFSVVGQAPKRYIVRAELVGERQRSRDASRSSEIVLF